MKTIFTFSLIVLAIFVASSSGYAVFWNIQQITDNDIIDEAHPSLYDGTIAWQGYDGIDPNTHEIYYWDGSTITQVTHNDMDDRYASHHSGAIAWNGGYYNGNSEIYYWDGSTTIQVTDNNKIDGSPSLYNGTIAWNRRFIPQAEVYYWDGSTTTQITDNPSTLDEDVSLYAGTIAWQGGYYNDEYEIYYWDGITTIQVTDNNTGDFKPSLYAGTIAWHGFDGNDYEIYSWDGTTTIQVTDDLLDNLNPSLYAGTIAWHRNGEIYYWDGNTITQVTNNNFPNGFFPSLYNGTIAWYGWDGNDYEIYYATPAPSAVSISTFTAASTGAYVLLDWHSETELDNVGFNIYRSSAEADNYTKIAFVPATEDSEMANDYQFTDKGVEPGKTYFYFLEDIDLAGKRNKSEVIRVVIPSAMPAPMPKEFLLLQNYPNPFNPDTWMPYQLADDAGVIIRVYDANGRLIRILDSGQRKAGYYLNKSEAAYWNGKDATGRTVSSGVYFYQLKAGDFVAVRKMVIMK